MSAKCIMIQGTMSDAGKSIVCAALCRIFRQDGYSVAPFKSQNMALNSYITLDGGEMGRAQVVQAEACGLEPDVAMNPVLLKPSSDTKSQVIVMGRVRAEMSAKEYHTYKETLMPEVKTAFAKLAEEHDIIVVEGAGSPAEINLADSDIVNMGLANELDLPVVLVGDIDRGGVFAQLYGTIELVAPEEKDRIKGTIINKFRGDVDILTPGLEMLELKTGIPVLGVIPMLDVDLEDEDSMSARLARQSADSPIDVAVIRLPRISNFTDMDPLDREDMAGVRYVRDVKEFGSPDLLIIPGTKNTTDDLLWLKECGLDRRIIEYAVTGAPVIGICGGYQMLGEKLLDPDRLEGKAEALDGLGLLPVETTFTPDKARTRVEAVVEEGPYAGSRLEGYEIHMGRTEVNGKSFCTLEDGTKEGCVRDNVTGTYLHGLFDSGEFTKALLMDLAEKKGLDPSGIRGVRRKDYVEAQYDKLADQVREALDMEKVYEILR